MHVDHHNNGKVVSRCFAYFIAVFLLNPLWNTNVLEPLTEPNIHKTIFLKKKLELVLIKFLLPNPIRNRFSQCMHLKHMWADICTQTHTHAHTWP